MERHATVAFTMAIHTAVTDELADATAAITAYIPRKARLEIVSRLSNCVHVR